VPGRGRNAWKRSGHDLRACSLTAEQQLLAILAAHPGPMRCREIVVAMGEDPRAARHGERVRHRMKKLVAADLVIAAVPGEFTRADGRDPAFR
jgi:hypothetical protein